MMSKKCFVISCFLFSLCLVLNPSWAEEAFVKLPLLKNNQASPRVIYIENPRFPKVEQDDLKIILKHTSAMVKANFNINLHMPEGIKTYPIKDIFKDLMKNKPDFLDDLIGDFKNDKVDWDAVKASLIKEISKQSDPLENQIAFATPYLVSPLKKKDIASFAEAVIETFKDRLIYWTSANLKDGLPVIGKNDLPFNEYGYWTLMARNGMKADIILTNQLVASVEYIPTPVHTSIRGGITGGSTEYNPKSQFGASVWVSLFPYFSNDKRILELRNGDTYLRAEALEHSARMLTHEIGHQLLQLGHPWSNKACIMRPAEVLDFRTWANNISPENCKINSSPAMKIGSTKAPIW